IPLGMFLDPLSTLIITAPLVYPVITSLGFSGIWFGILMVKTVEIALITPPVGINVYVIKGITPDISLETIFRGIGLFLLMDVITMVILIGFPQLSLWLPMTMFD
ncbi:TRAP transporter large permease subunit, partial [Chloroflexota bacterium]